jgi:uracil DNA glycosylase
MHITIKERKNLTDAEVTILSEQKKIWYLFVGQLRQKKGSELKNKHLVNKSPAIPSPLSAYPDVFTVTKPFSTHTNSY